MKTVIEQQDNGVSVTLLDDPVEGQSQTGSQWNMQGDQIEKHMAGIDDKAHPFNRVSRGDLSAARDMANESKKQIES